MKILVPVKRVPDPTQKAKIKDGHIDLTGASWIVNTFDEYAVETALRLLENGEANTRTGRRDRRRVDRPRGRGEGDPHVARDGRRPRDPRRRERRRDRLARRRQSAARRSSRPRSPTSSSWASRPSTATRTRSARCSPASSAGRRRRSPRRSSSRTKSLLVGREVDGGVEYKRVPVPAVVTVDLRIVGPKAVQERRHARVVHATRGEGARLPSLKGIMAAKKKPIDDRRSSPTTAPTPQPVIKELSASRCRRRGRPVRSSPTSPRW